ncbi:XrtA system polysaccharide deacetylase [Hyphococcus sp.]|uniref:XrtA system polysaccharide deacetylase n=1 Tax=Hyphococcus sp. TaxID=2038636 RepID=UPI003CCBEE50
MSKTSPDLENENRFAMSVDVEDYFQVWAFSDIVQHSQWDDFSLRVGDTTRRCLDLFDAHNAKATFFTLGWVAERDPALVQEIVKRGHELASHGYNHTKVDQQTKSEFLADVKKTKSLLEDIGGVEVKGYRAAGFSISANTPWAHEALAEAGHLYSSSTHPIAHDHYGDKGADRNIYYPLRDARFIEAPVATAQIAGKRVSAAGGGWFRAAPLNVSKYLLARAARTLDGPVIFYFHPWEIDPDQPRMHQAKLKSKLRHYLNLNRMQQKLAAVLSMHRWSRLDDTLGLGIKP